MGVSQRVRDALLLEWNCTEKTVKALAIEYQLPKQVVRNIIQTAQRSGQALKRTNWRKRAAEEFTRDPAYKEKVSKRTRQIWADPDTAARMRAAMTAAGKGRKHLRDLTPEQREQYHALRKAGRGVDAALETVRTAAT